MTLNQATVLKPLKGLRLLEQKTRILRFQVIFIDSKSLRHGDCTIYDDRDGEGGVFFLDLQVLKDDVLTREGVFARDCPIFELG